MGNDFLSRLMVSNIDRQKEWNTDHAVDLSYDALEFMTEAGELGEQVKKLIRENRGLKGNRTDLTKIKEEVGDVMITLDKLLTTVSLVTGQEIDIEDCTREKFNKTSTKYGFKTMFKD